MDGVSATEIVSRLEAVLPPSNVTQRYQGLVAGSGAATIRGILVANIPNVAALRRAAATNCNFIISRQHPYFYQGGITDRGNQQTLRGDPVVEAKRKLIESGLAVYRIEAAWDAAKPRSVAAAFAAAMGWQPVASGGSGRTVYCDVAKTTLGELARRIVTRSGARGLRITAEANTAVSRIAITPGMEFGSEIMAAALRDKAVDAVLTDVVLDVDGGCPYIQDAIAAGRRIGLIQTGCERFEFPVAQEVARFVRGVFPEMKMDVAPESEPYWMAS